MRHKHHRLLIKHKKWIHTKGLQISSPLNNINFSSGKRQISMECGLITPQTKIGTPANLAKHKAVEESQTEFLGEITESSPSLATIGTGTITHISISQKISRVPIIRIKNMCYYFSGEHPLKSKLYMFVPQSYGNIIVETQEIPSIGPRMLYAACEYKKLYLIHGGLASYWNTHSKIDPMKFDSIDPFTYKVSTLKLTGDAISPRYSHTICSISDNKVILYGGVGKRRVPCGDAFIIDFETQTVSSVSKPPIAVGGVSSVLVDGVVYFFGGLSQKRYYNTLFYYNLSSSQWGERILRDIPPRQGASLIAFGSNLLIVGGRNDLDIFTDIWNIDLTTFEPRRLVFSGDMFLGKSGGSCIKVNGNSFLLIGGYATPAGTAHSYLIALS